MNIYNSFKPIGKVEEETIINYKEDLPKELIEAWRTYGYGTLLNGYLKVINPDDFSEMITNTYVRNKGTIPIFATSMGEDKFRLRWGGKVENLKKVKLKEHSLTIIVWDHFISEEFGQYNYL